MIIRSGRLLAETKNEDTEAEVRRSYGKLSLTLPRGTVVGARVDDLPGGGVRVSPIYAGEDVSPHLKKEERG